MNRTLKLAAVAAAVLLAQPAFADKVKVCHSGKTLSVASSALAAHLGHGDAEGVCPAIVQPEPLPIAVALLRCDTVDGDILVISSSASEELEVPVQLPVLPDYNCATAIAAMLNNGWDLQFVTSGASTTVGEGESGFVTEYTFIDDHSSGSDAD